MDINVTTPGSGGMTMENEKLIAALRYCDAVVNDTVNTGGCNFCPYRDHCSDLDNEAADALERLQAELDAAKKCINDVQTYLDLGSAKYIAATIKQWRGKEHD